jgi:hypothetical protein
MTATADVFARLGLQRIENLPPRRRVVWSIEGMEKTGKTTLALTAPGPIAFLDIDIGAEGVVEKLDRKDIFMRQYRYAEDIRKNLLQIKEYANKIWMKFLNDYYELLEASDSPNGPRTIVLDTATDFWNLCLNAHLGKDVQMIPTDRTKANDAFGPMIKAAYAHSANLLLLHQMKPEFENKKNLERQGFNKIGNIVQATINTRRKPKPKQDEFEYVITLNRSNTSLEGEVLDGKLYDFSTLAELIVEGSNVEDWQ